MADNPDLADAYGGPVKISPSIFAHVEEGLKKNPDGPAVTVMHQPASHLASLVDFDIANRDGSGGCLSWTHTQLHRAAMRMASGLIAYGVKPGSTLVTLIPNRVEWPLLLLTSVIMQATLAPLDPGALAAARIAELNNLTETLRPDVIVVSDTTAAKAVDDPALNSESSRAIKIVLDPSPEGNNPAGWSSLLAIAERRNLSPLAESELLQRVRDPNPDHTAMILFTSGTSSGKPKGCPRHNASIAFTTVSLLPNIRMTEPGCIYSMSLFGN